MKESQIIEGNSLIARFMGWKQTAKNLKWISRSGEEYDNRAMFSGWIKQDQEYSKDIPLVVVNMHRSVVEYKRKLQYHESWDWLMPVVEKIEYSLPDDIVIGISYKDCVILLMSEEEDISCNGNTKIEAVWLAAVEFIKWYNSQPK